MRQYTTDYNALRKIMVDNDIRSVTALASTSGVDRNTLGLILNGKKQPSADVMDKLISALHMEPGVAGQVFFAHNFRSA
jgi:transcriptional regulator with XRE-family HTH domain